MPVASRVAPLAVLTALCLASLLAPAAVGHPGAAIVLEAREQEACIEGPVCLELASIPFDLAPGHETALELRTHAEASQGYAASVTTLDRADRDHRDTPASEAIVTTPEAAPGGSARVNLTVPQASQLYVWLADEGAEAEGGWERVPVDIEAAADGEASQRSAPGVGVAGVLTALAGTVAVLAGAGRLLRR